MAACFLLNLDLGQGMALWSMTQGYTPASTAASREAMQDPACDAELSYRPWLRLDFAKPLVCSLDSPGF